MKTSLSQDDFMKSNKNANTNTNAKSTTNATTVTSTNRSSLLFEQFKINISDISVLLLPWKYLHTNDEIALFTNAIITAVISLNDSFKNNNLNHLNHSNILINTNNNNTLLLYQLLNEKMLSRTLVFWLISSLYPGDPFEIGELARKLYDILPQDTNLSINKFMDYIIFTNKSIDSLKLLLNNNNNNNNNNQQLDLLINDEIFNQKFINIKQFLG